MRTLTVNVMATVVLATLLRATPAAAITLQQAISTAQDNDPWLSGSQLQEASLQARGVAAGSLPDPTVSVGLANLPTDTFDFDQGSTDFTTHVRYALTSTRDVHAYRASRPRCGSVKLKRLYGCVQPLEPIHARRISGCR